MNEFGIRELYAPDMDHVLDVVLLHGLDGDAQDTWRHQSGGFWPDWLSNQFPRIRVLSVNHPSKKFAELFAGGGMSLINRSRATLDLLLAHSVGTKPVIFVAHSLGGLIIKAVLRRAKDQGGPKNNRLLANVAGIVFLATPHDGSGLANLLNVIPILPSDILDDLKEGSDQLLDLKDWYIAHAAEQKIPTKAFCESKPTGGIIVVSQTSAAPGPSDGSPVPSDASHADICKFASSDNAIYRSIESFIADCCTRLSLDPSSSVSRDDLDYYTVPAEGDRKTLEEKLSDGGRADEIRFAIAQKERIAKILTRNVLSSIDRAKNKDFLGNIVSRFTLAVSPRIHAGDSRIAVNSAIQDAVINPLLDLNDHPLANQDDVHAAVYYLTGHCHIAWDAPEDD